METVDAEEYSMKACVAARLGSSAALRLALGRCVELGADDTTAIDAKFHLSLLAAAGGREAHRIWREIVMDYPDNPHMKFAELMSGQEAP